MYGCVALCTAIERNVFHILANGEPLYDAYTTYLPAIEESPLDKDTDISHRYIHVVWYIHDRVIVS